MKKLIIICMAVVCICFVLTGETYAQRQLPGMQGIQVTGGITEHSGYHFGTSIATYTKGANKWVFGAEYLQKDFSYKDINIPVAQFTAEGGYYFKFLSDHNKIVLFSLGGSALAGYETVNWGDDLLFDGSTLQHKDKFLYGGAITLEIETYLSDRVVLLLTGRERILWGTTTGHFHTQLGLGVKFIIN